LGEFVAAVVCSCEQGYSSILPFQLWMPGLRARSSCVAAARMSAWSNAPLCLAIAHSITLVSALLGRALRTVRLQQGRQSRICRSTCCLRLLCINRTQWAFSPAFVPSGSSEPAGTNRTWLPMRIITPSPCWRRTVNFGAGFNTDCSGLGRPPSGGGSLVLSGAEDGLVSDSAATCAANLTAGFETCRGPLRNSTCTPLSASSFSLASWTAVAGCTAGNETVSMDGALSVCGSGTSMMGTVAGCNATVCATGGAGRLEGAGGGTLAVGVDLGVAVVCLALGACWAASSGSILAVAWASADSSALATAIGSPALCPLRF